MAAKPKTTKPKAPAKPAKQPLSVRAKADPKLLARALANPGLRYQLADNQLTAPLLAARREAVFQKAFGDIEHPLSGHPLIEAAKRITDAQYKPKLDELDVQDAKGAASSDAQQGWIKDYGKTIGDIHSAGIRAQADAAAAHTAALAAARTKALDAVSGQAADQAARAAGRDPGLDGGAAAALAAGNQALAARANSEATANEAHTRNTDAAQAAFLASMAAAQQTSMQEAAGQVGTRAANARAENDAVRKSIAENRGNDYTANLLKLRGDAVQQKLTQDTLSSNEQKAVLQAQTAAAGVASREKIAGLQRALSVRLQTMGTDARTADAMAERAFRAQQNDADRAQSDTNNRRSSATKPGAAKSKYLTKGQQTTAWQGIHAAAEVIKAQLGKPSDPKDKNSPKWTYETLRSHVKVSGAQLEAAIELARSGRVSSKTANALHGDGLQVKGHAQLGRRPKRK